jgi:hypothetical protein
LEKLVPDARHWIAQAIGGFPDRSDPNN